MSYNPDEMEVSVEQEIAATFMGRPHVVLLGAGASKAALPNGDSYGVPVPLLRDVSKDLHLDALFPEDLVELASSDFEAAYSRLADRDLSLTTEIDQLVRSYFEALELPPEPNLYDVLNLSLRSKDAICTFNWDPFLMQSRIRLVKHGAKNLPRLHFLHGNVLAGFCKPDNTMGLIGRRCSRCGERFEPSPLLFPVEKKNYQDGGFIEGEWMQTRELLANCFMLTVFGYSAPVTDVEAVELLRSGWGEREKRMLEQTEVVNRPGSDHDELRKTWDPFIHTHHYEIHDSFYDSWIANHPRRTGEAFWHQYLDAKFITDNPVPPNSDSLDELVAWFSDLRAAEEAAAEKASQD